MKWLAVAVWVALMLAPTEAARPRPGTVAGSVRVYEWRDGQRRVAAGAAGVVVYVPGVREALPVKRKPARLTFRDGEPQPEVVPMIVGQTLEVRNADARHHEPFSRSEARPFDLGMMLPGAVARVRFERPGLVAVHCNLHQEEAGYVLVLPTGPATLTAHDGTYSLAGVPSGRQRIVAWTPRARPVVKTVEIEAGDSVDLDLVVSESLVVGPHPNKYGGEYPPPE